MNRLIFVLPVLLLGFLTCGAFTAHHDTGLPEYVGIFMARVSGGGGDYVALERVTPVLRTRVRGLGFGGAEEHDSFAGEASPVRFKAGQPIEFITRVASQDQDPATFIQFFILKVGKGDRVLPMINVSPFGIHSGST